MSASKALLVGEYVLLSLLLKWVIRVSTMVCPSHALVAVVDAALVPAEKTVYTLEAEDETSSLLRGRVI